MRILLAGSTGHLGRRVRVVLERDGHEVVGLSRSETTGIAVDLLDRPAVLEAVAGERFDAIVHYATDLRRGATTHRSMSRTNRLRLEGTSALVAVAKATGATKMVSGSAFYGYGLQDHGDEPLTETSLFGVTVGSANDDVLRALESLEQQTAAIKGVNLRLGLVYGGRPLPAVASDFDALLPLIHVDDVAEATSWALDKGRAGHSYNIVDDVSAPLAEFQLADRLAAHAPGLPPLPSWLLRARAPFGAELLTRTRMQVSNAKARRAGWRPRFPSYKQGLDRSADVVDAILSR